MTDIPPGAQGAVQPTPRDGCGTLGDMIPLTRPLLGAQEEAEVAAVLRTGMLVQGARVAEFEAQVAAFTQRRHAIALTNGTSALHLALLALGVRPGDRVLCPDLTWPSPVHAVLDIGAEPVLIDVDEREWNSGPLQFAAALEARPRAAIAIDQFGNPARVPEIAAALGSVPLVMDAACSLGSRLGGAACGSFGPIACTSFHPRKVITTGEGGMCLTDDDALASALRELRNHGQHAPGHFARAAGNHRMSEIGAAIGSVQMQRLPGIVSTRVALAARYHEAFAELPLQWQHSAPGAQANHQTFGIVLQDARLSREHVVEALARHGVQAGALSHAVHRLPHMTQYAAAAASAGRNLHVSASIAARGLALPLFPGMTDAEQQQVIDAVRTVLS
jgi:perosamine synthetase